MKKYSKEEIETTLEKIDCAIDRPVKIVVIGGSAAVLKYDVVEATKDIDYIDDSPSLEQLLKNTGLTFDIPIEKVNVYDAPWNYQERLIKEESLELSNLNVFYPEVHDLILMKSIRSNENDLQMIEEICKNNKVSSKISKRKG